MVIDWLEVTVCVADWDFVTVPVDEGVDTCEGVAVGVSPLVTVWVGDCDGV